MAKTIPLTRGYVTTVDDKDYEELSCYKWRAVGSRWVYAVTTIPGVVGKSGRPKPTGMHRLILGIVEESYKVYGDHINGDTLDNRRCNLRITDNKGNQGNRHRPHSTSATSTYRGVVWNKPAGKWSARIKIDRHLRYIGSFESEDDAALAYDCAARSHFGEFAALNLPERLDEHTALLLGPLNGPKRSYGLGVSGRDGRWRAYVYADGKQKHIGWFPTKDEALEARKQYLNARR